MCVIDWNKGQNDGYSKDFSDMYDNLQERLQSFGWDCKVVNGHNMKAIRKSLKVDKTVLNEKPLCLVLDTIKGKGISFMERVPKWHHRKLKEDEYQMAMNELTTFAE